MMLLAPVPPAAAQPKGSAQDEARALGEKAVEAFKAQRWAEAYDLFSKADAVFHAPTLVSFMAECKKNQGHLLEARALYQRVAGEALPASAPAQFKRAQENARGEVTALARRIPSARVVVRGGGDGVSVTVDGAPLPA